MALFPAYDELRYLPGIQITPRFNTSITTISGGEEKRRAKQTFPLYDIKISYDTLTIADARTLWQFYKDRQGSFGSFYFYLPYLDSYDAEYCGTGDGTTTVFDVPGKDIYTYIVYDGGAAQTEGVGNDYIISQGAGVEGAAQITFTGAPVTGNHITVDFVGYYRFKVRFADDNLPFEVFAQTLIKMGISLVGVR